MMAKDCGNGSGLATREDVVSLYRKLLGREPESVDVVEKRVGRSLIDVAIVFAQSAEFTERMVCRARRKDVVGLYNALLKRKPESEEAIKSKLNRPVVEVVDEIAKSGEFAKLYASRVDASDISELHKLLLTGPLIDTGLATEVARIANVHGVRVSAVVRHMMAMARAQQAAVRNETSAALDWPEPESGSFRHSEGLGNKVELVIPTVNSERWLGQFLEFYKVNGLRPVYAVDRRTSDGTRELIRKYGFTFIEAQADEPRVEALLPSIVAQIAAPWILRLDDDELPTPKLLDFATAAMVDDAISAYSFPRANLRCNPASKRLERSYFFAFGPDAGLDRQWRLFQPKDVAYRGELHTPGFLVSNGRRVQPDAYILHFDWVLRSKQARLRKFESYERQSPSAAKNCKHHTLHEVVPEAWHLFREVDNEILQQFAQKLHVI